ncbi:hypothetical protein ACTXT7_010088 [Hymenolepis weldensis]
MNTKGKGLNREISQTIAVDVCDELRSIPSLASVEAGLSMVIAGPSLEEIKLQAEREGLENDVTQSGKQKLGEPEPPH